MITGTVTSQREAIIRLIVCGPSGQQEEVDAVIDTGFNDFLTLPRPLISLLGLMFAAPALATLAGGSVVPLDYYRTSVVCDGQPRPILVLKADGGPLVGMALLSKHRLILDVVDQGRVTIEPLP